MGNSPTGRDNDDVLVSRARLTGYIRSLIAGSTKGKQVGLPVAISTEGPNVKSEADGCRFTLPKEVVEFPEPPLYGAEHTVTLDRDTMQDTITRLQLSAGRDNTPRC